MNSNFRKALVSEIPQIWEILKLAIARRKEEGSNQWQDGYPNPDVIQNDIDKSVGYVLLQDNSIVGYCAILVNDEPEYANIIGKWITDSDFVVFHRVAISENYLGQGLAKKMFQHIEGIAGELSIKSIKVDTNFDNIPMLKIFEKLGYVYCGEVYFRGSARKAFEKVLI